MLLRALVGVACGAAVAVPTLPVLGIAAALLSAWTVFAVVQVIWVLRTVWSMDAAATRAHARAEDPGRRLARVITVAGSIASLGAVAVVLVDTDDTSRGQALILAAVAVVSVASSWTLIQVDYMLRLAAAYFSDPEGGIDFNQDEDPMYTDFAYVSFGLGMTYQVADTNIRTNGIRRLVIAQTLLAYLFGAVILATVINLATGL